MARTDARWPCSGRRLPRRLGQEPAETDLVGAVRRKLLVLRRGRREALHAGPQRRERARRVSECRERAARVGIHLRGRAVGQRPQLRDRPARNANGRRQCRLHGRRCGEAALLRLSTKTRRASRRPLATRSVVGVRCTTAAVGRGVFAVDRGRPRRRATGREGWVGRRVRQEHRRASLDSRAEPAEL